MVWYLYLNHEVTFRPGAPLTFLCSDLGAEAMHVAFVQVSRRKRGGRLRNRQLLRQICPSVATVAGRIAVGTRPAMAPWEDVARIPVCPHGNQNILRLLACKKKEYDIGDMDVMGLDLCCCLQRQVEIQYITYKDSAITGKWWR